MRPDQVLPDDVDHGQFNGVTVRKGTVAAFLANARLWGDRSAGTQERLQAQAQIVEDLPALRALGLFDVMEIRDDALRAFVAAVRFD